MLFSKLLRKKLKEKMVMIALSLTFLGVPLHALQNTQERLPLYYWNEPTFLNFGDYLSLKLVERMVNTDVEVFVRKPGLKRKKLLALGSILSYATDDDVIWGTGANGKWLDKKNYKFNRLDVRAVRGPLTRKFLQKHFNQKVPEVYGDPGLLFPYLYPEFKKRKSPKYEYIIIPHYSEQKLFPKKDFPNVVYPTEPWDRVIQKILDSRFVISSSLHGLVIAEAYGIPARLLKVTFSEPLFKYEDYYLGTHRPNFQFATSIEEALDMGGEEPCVCDLKKLYDAFPFEFWPEAKPRQIIFPEVPICP